MGRPKANDRRDINMFELATREMVNTPTLALESSSSSTNDDGMKSNGPLSTTTTTATTSFQSSEISSSRTSREVVLRRLSDALLRHSLVEIDLSQRGLQSSDARLVKMALSQNSTLTVLKLGYNNLGDHGVSTLAGGIALHKSLRLLDLGFNNFGDEGAKALASAMHQASKAPNGGTLHTLYLAGNLIGEDGAVAMADFIRQGSNLRKLYMTGNRIGANGVRAIAEAILEDETRRIGGSGSCPSIGQTSSMDHLHDNRSNGRFSTTLTATTKQKFEGMQELFLGGTGIGSPGCQTVSRLLESSTSLKVISLPNCDIGDDEISLLSSSFRANKANLPIESIQLSFNRITHRGLEALSNALWGSMSLKELKLDNNEIGDRGAHQIAAILPALKGLVTLDVGFNVIKAAGLNVLMKAVVDTDQIESLSLSGNDIDVPSAKAVAYTLAYNQTLKSIYLVHCSINHEGKRHITAGAVSNSHTSLRNLTGFDVGPIVVTLGFPDALRHWNNEQVMNFIHLMYERRERSQDESQFDAIRELDPLSFLPGGDGRDTSAVTRPPLEASLVVEIATKTYTRLIANGVDVFSRRRSVVEPSFGSPLASDTIIIETRASTLTINDNSNGNHCNDHPQNSELLVNPARSFVVPPESNVDDKKPDMPDPARKQRIIEWLCTNIEHLNELAQLPFSSRELWRLHQHYFTPVVNESGGVMIHAGSGAVSSVPEGIREYQGSGTLPSTESCGEAVPVSDPAFQGPPTTPASLPMLKRKVSYRFLADAAGPSHCSRTEAKLDSRTQNGLVAKLIEEGVTGHSLPPKTKRARRNRTRISFVPRIKAKLDSYMDVCHEKALITMRQLYFVEQAILKGQVNSLDKTPQPLIHLAGILASEAEMIIVDMI